MPRGEPKKLHSVRLPPPLVAEVRALTDDLTAAVERGLALWLREAQRKQTRKRKMRPQRLR